MNQTINPISLSVRYLGTNFTVLFLKFLVALIILLLGFIIGRVAGRFIQNTLKELEINKFVNKRIKLNISFEKMVGSFVSYLVYFISILLALDQVGLTTTLMYILTWGLVLVIILSFLLAVKDFLPNLVGGLIIHYKKMISKGDHVKILNIKGHVNNITLVNIEIKTKSGDIIYIPNFIAVKNEMIKYPEKNQ